MNNPTYWDVHEVISTYAADLVTLFADGWERFPQGKGAKMLIERLRQKADWWRNRGDEAHYAEKYARISAAADEIQRHLS